MYEHIIVYYTAKHDAANKAKAFVRGDFFWQRAEAYCDLQDQDEPISVPAWRAGLQNLPKLATQGLLNGSAAPWR